MKHYEYQLQCCLMERIGYLRHKYPALDLIHAIPNGEARTARAGARLKKMGVRAGMPDLCLPVPSGFYDTNCPTPQYHALYIELKYGRGKTSEVQIERIDKLREAGNRVEICYNVDEAWATICDYLRIEL